jgi:ribosomal protein L23
MSTLELLQNEKSSFLALKNTFVLVAREHVGELNKIEVTKILAKHKLDAEGIRVVLLPAKTRTANAKKRTTKRVSRPKKFYVTLKKGQSITDKTNITF